jgi:hypothetical protein
MKTYKETLYKKWWKQNLMSSVPFFCILLVLVFTNKVEYLLLVIPILLISSFFGGVKCPSCKNGMHIPPTPKRFKALNYCAECGFDLNQEVKTTWVDRRLDETSKQGTRGEDPS